MKRVIDLILGIVSFVVLSPLLLIIAILVLVVLGSPVFFRQIRPGRYARPFKLIKFRTMSDGPGTDEARLGKFGRFLRANSLDELPELVNIIKGEMSLVGPRPLLMEYLPLYSEEQARRHDVRPGLTGWAQVNGRNALSWEDKFALDVWYVDNQSLWLDVKILLMTVMKVVKRDGVSHTGEATMPRFTGRDKE